MEDAMKRISRIMKRNGFRLEVANCAGCSGLLEAELCTQEGGRLVSCGIGTTVEEAVCSILKDGDENRRWDKDGEDYSDDYRTLDRLGWIPYEAGSEGNGNIYRVMKNLNTAGGFYGEVEVIQRTDGSWRASFATGNGCSYTGDYRSLECLLNEVDRLTRLDGQWTRNLRYGGR